MDIFTRKHVAAWLIGGLVAINLITLGALWFTVLHRPAAAPPRRPDDRPADVGRFLERELNLDAGQAAQFEELRRRSAAQIKSVQEDIRRLKRAETDELLGVQPDKAKLEALADEIGKKEAEKEKLLFAHLQDLMALCRPDQQQKLRSIMDELLRLMGPPGQPKPEAGPAAKRPPRGPGDQPPERIRPDRQSEEPPPDRPPRRPGEPPPRRDPE